MAATILVVTSEVRGRRRYHSPLRTEQADDTRQRVVTAAKTLFIKRGYAGTTVAAVAEAAGVSPDTVYVSLGGKRGLLECVLSQERSHPDDDHQGDPDELSDIARLADPHERLRRLVELSCSILARTSPIHAVIRGAADGHPFAAELRARMLRVRLDIQARNLHDCLGAALREGLTADEAAERYSALLSPELFHLVTVERRWSTARYAHWVTELLDQDLLG